MEETIKRATEEKMDRKYRDFICKLEGSIQKAHTSNDKLSRQLFTLNNRIINVAEKIGFTSFDDFEEAVLDEQEVWKVDSIKANYIRAQAAGGSRVGTPTSASFREELEQLKRQVHELQQRSVERVGDDVKSSTPARRPPFSPLKLNGDASCSELSRLRAELGVLSRKYDSLATAKESAEKKYKEDYKKWRDFKSWLSTKSKHAKALREQLDGKLCFGDEFRDSTDEGNSIQNEIPGPKRSSASRSAEGENMCLARSRPPPPKPTIRSTVRLSASKLRIPKSERCPSRASTSRSQSPSPVVKQRKKVHSGPLKLKTELANDAPELHHLLCDTVEIEGGLTHAASAERTINALYTIDTSRNNGLPFQFDEVVRGREHRQRLEAGDCDCCKEYYDRLEPLPSRPAPPLWLSSPKLGRETVYNPHKNRSQDEAAASHKQQISRHRFQWSPAETPPDYWNIGFPTTQEAADINQRAAEMHAKKRRRIEKEANTVGGRYIRRKNEAGLLS